MSEQKERPIIFSGAMVRTIFEGRKTQTRRVVKPQPDFIYGITGDKIEPVFINSEAVNELNQACVWNSSEADTDLSELGLHGGERWSRVLADTLQRIRQEGIRGLVCISRSPKREGVFDCLVVPRKQEGDEARPSPRVHGIPRDASVSDGAGAAPGRTSRELHPGQFEMGNSARQLDGSQSPWPRHRGREASRSEADRCGTRALAVGTARRSVQPKARGADAWNEPSCNISHCRYEVGSRLWVRETWCCVHGVPAANGKPHAGDFVRYRADAGAGEAVIDDVHGWAPSIHMPRVYSRITLEVTGVRVERLQDISAADVAAEGVDVPRCPKCGYTRSDCHFHMDHHICGEPTPCDEVSTFRAFWDSINAKLAPWASNPWVWVVEFKRQELGA